jgi:hypothetical protein
MRMLDVVWSAIIVPFSRCARADPTG